MKNFQSFALYLSLFALILLSSHPLLARQKFEKGDKVEVKLVVNKEEVWTTGTYERYYKKKHRVSYSYNIDGWKGGGEYHPFEDHEIRPFTGNITTTFKKTASNEAAKKAKAEEISKNPFKKGDKVEIKIPVNEQEAWIEGTYVIFNKGQHRVNYKYDIDGWNGYGQLKPFDDEHIRPFSGNITTTFYEGVLQKNFTEGQKVEVLVMINEKPVWIEGIYNQAYEGKHRVSYQYKGINEKKGWGDNMPFDDDQIREFVEKEKEAEAEGKKESPNNE